MKYKILSLIAALVCCLTVGAACPDFTDLSSLSVTATTGYTSDPFAATGVVNGRHTLITAQGTDPNTGGALNLLPPGESQVIRLGNDQVGAQAEALTYRFTVDKDNAVLLLKFAVVLEDPGHDIINQPRFVVRVMDENGNMTEECAEYDVRASADIPGFQTYQKSSWQTIRWRDWTNVGLDLSKYIGKTVQVQFTTYDCELSGHFGYAYFTASCMSNLLKLQNCGIGNYTLEAPDNFESYLWDNGDQTRTTTRSAAVTDAHVSCVVTSATGCLFTLYGYITAAPVTVPAFIQATICEGESYNENNFDLPPQSPSVHTYYNTFFNPVTCSSQTTELKLTVIQRYNHFKAAICHGENYIANGFEIIEPAVGVRRDTIKVGNSAGCDEFNILELTVNLSLSMPNIIEGDASPCTNELRTYAFAGSESLTKFEWELPANAVVTKGRYTPLITMYFTDATPGQIILKGENGCGSGTASLSVKPNQTYHIQFNEQVCEGDEYNGYGFNLGVQDSVGYFVYEKHLKASSGCDSSVVLALNVLPMPVVHIEPKDPMICNPGDEITLWALTDDMQYAGNQDGINIPCGDYADYYDALTPNDPADFQVVPLINSDSCVIVTYLALNEKVVIPHEIGGAVVFIIAQDAFAMKNVTEAVIPPTVETIMDKAFNTCASLASVVIPESVTFISADAFDNSPNVVIYCYENSYAHQYAIDNSINFKLIEACNDNITFVDIYDCSLDYLWNTGATTGFITVDPAATTNYTVTITTANGCSATANQTVLVNTNTPISVNDTICAGETYTGYGLEVSTSGSYNTTIQKDDCNVPVTINLFVRQPAVEKIIATVCAGERYQQHGLDLQLYQPGIFHDTLHFVSHAGCDSMLILEITVNPMQEIILRDTVCQNQPYTQNGFNLPVQAIAGEFMHTQISQTPQNCESKTTLKLFVAPVFHAIISDEVEKDSAYNKYNFNFPKVMQDTTVTENLTSVFGCDSMVTLNLKLKAEDPSKCPNGTLLFKEDFGGNDPDDLSIKSTGIPQVIGYTYNPDTAGTGRYSIRKQGQSHSVWMQMDDHTYPNDLTKGYLMLVDGSTNPAGQFYSTQIDDLCVGSTLYFSMWAASISPGYSEGNLSIIIEDLGGNELTRYDTGPIPTAININDWTRYGTSFTITPATPSVVFKIMNNNHNASGNDFVLDDIEIRLCTPPVEVNAPDSVCVGEDAKFTTSFTNDGTLTEPLEYLWLKSETGDLTSQDDWLSVATSDTLKLDNIQKTDEGYYRLAIAGQGGILQENCRAMSDPILLFVKEDCAPPPCIVDSLISTGICLGESILFGGNHYKTAGIYRDTIPLSNNCDSIVILDLTVHLPDTTRLVETIHIGEGYSANGFHFPLQYSAGLLTDTLFLQTNQHNCDSIVILNLEITCVSPVNTPPFYATVCQGDSYNENGFSLPPQDVVGNYTHRQELLDIYNCDSIVSLHLTVNPLYDDTLMARIPVNEPYSANGFTVPPQPKPGFFVFENRFEDLSGCDSVTTLLLSVYAKIIPDEFFTPNGDGVGDVWNIKNIEYFEVDFIGIYDRFGKLLMQYTEKFIPWNGTYLGKNMPSTDYWYIITLREEEKQEVGHFTLIR